MNDLINWPDAEAIVVDAGEFPADKRARHWIDTDLPVVCCDGAAEKYLATGKIPWRIVGDLDSLSGEIKERYHEIVRHIPEQETNDQTKSVRYLANKGFRHIVILGATGKREDHTLGNISLLIDYLKHGIEARIYTDYGIFIPVKDSVKLNLEPSVQISIFNFGSKGMRAKGLKYKVRDFDNWWEGTLNEAISREVKISARGYFLIYLAFQGQYL